MSKNQRILDLARAQVSPAEIIATLNIPKTTVYRVLKHGRVERLPRGPPKNKKLTEKFVAKSKEAVEANPTLSIRAHAKKLKVSERTVRRGLQKLKKRSLVRPPVPLLTERLKESRYVKAKKLLARLKKETESTVRIFSDKKIFTVDQAYNRRNDRVLVDQGQPAIPVSKTKHPAGVMVLGIVASNGKKCPAIFVPAGAKVNTECYIDLLKTNLLPWLCQNYPAGKRLIWFRAINHNNSDFFSFSVFPKCHRKLSPLTCLKSEGCLF